MNYPKIIKWLSAIIIVFSTGILIGWFFKIEFLKTVLPDTNPIHFLSAFCFLLIGLTLLCAAYALQYQTNELIELIIPGVTITIMFIMIILIVANYLGLDTSIETVFLGQAVRETGPVPGVPSLPSIINFILTSFSFLLILFKNEFYNLFFKLIGIFIALNGLIALVGYLIQVPFLYYKFDANDVAMPFNSAILFVLVGLSFISFSNFNLKNNAAQTQQIAK